MTKHKSSMNTTITFVTQKELEENMLKKRIFHNPEDPSKVQIILEQSIETIKFDGTRKTISATVLIPYQI